MYKINYSYLKQIISIFWLLLSFTICAQADVISPRDIVSPIEAKNAMVVVDEPLAAQVGLNILKRGGNAVDAAVAIGFTMAVTYPRAGNLGGGGFMLIFLAKTSQVIAIDYRETAPALAHNNMFLDKEGNVNKQLSRFSHLSVGVPGTVAGLALALEKYGTLSLAETLAPAITLAEKGFIIPAYFARDLKQRINMFQPWEASQATFLKPDGTFYEMGDLFVQPELATTLKRIAEQGIRAFYQGDIAQLIVKDMKAYDGLIRLSDLSAYKPVIRQPVHGTYRGYDVYSMSPPSSGGVHILQILNTLEQDDIKNLGHNSAATIHLMSEAMKYAYADRSEYLGDPDFVEVPIAGLIDKNYAAQLRSHMNEQTSTPSEHIWPGACTLDTSPTVCTFTRVKLKPHTCKSTEESKETTHYSIIDKAGNAVSNTYTLNFSFGSGIVVPGAGFLLNNEMNDFSAKPGTPNAYGLVGGCANAIVPHKRMLSSMSPTIVLKDGQPFLITGSPGGSRIITTTLQVLMNVIDHGMNIQEAVNAVRIHHQWLPDEIRIEEGVSVDTLRLLKQMGHKVVTKNTMGAASSILIDQTLGIYYGAADPRRQGVAFGF